MNELVNELLTLRDWLRYAVSQFSTAGLFFGHGCDNAYDEAAWLILHTLHLPHDRLEPFLDARLTRNERLAVHHILQLRVAKRMPAAYLTNEAWLGAYHFYVDQRVIVPRSYLGALLEDRLAPWLGAPEKLRNALDLCTGSGCLAILMAYAFPEAHIDAVDLSSDALSVAQRNVTEYGLEGRIQLVKADLFAGLAKHRYELIVSNPPYVTAAAMAALPLEYHHEPMLALAAGEDGLDFVRRILNGAHFHLKPQGLLAVEVGHNRDLVENAFPDLPLTWVDCAGGEDKIFIIHKEQLAH